jgi:putative DNA primase/helicase
MTGKARSKKNSSRLFDAEPEPWLEPVDGAELLDALVVTFRRYLALPEGAAETLALWVVFTHAIDASAVAPRLAILSPIPRCGKTTLLGLLIRLVHRSLPTSNVTPAVVYRVIARDQPTLLIDEADTFFDGRSELRGIVNSGHSRDTAFVDRCDVDNHEPRRFATYAAIAVAKIGKLPAALHDRCLVIRMQRKRSDDNIERFREDRAASELIDLKHKVVRWAADNVSLLKGADPDIPNALNDRAADNWRILLAIADLARGHWPDAARRVAVLISGDEEDTSLSVQLLHDVRDIFDDLNKDRLSTAELVRQLEFRDDRPWATLIDGVAITGHRIASMLEPFGIRQKVMRIGDKTLRGYERAQFADAWSRYPRSQTATPQQDSDFNGLEDRESATQTATNGAQSATAPEAVADREVDVADHVAVSAAENYNDINLVAGVAVPGGESPERPPASRIDLGALFAAEHPSIPPSRRGRGPRKGRPREGRKPSKRP